MKKLRWPFIVVLSGAAIAAGVAFFARTDAPAVAGEPSAEPPARAAAPGVVEPAGEERDLAAEATGALISVLVEENEHVRAGQPLATIRSDELEAKLESAKALVALRESELERLKNGARPEERRSMAAEADAAAALATLAQADWSRSERLFGSGTISASAFDASRHGHDSAAAKLRAANERLALIKAPARRDEVAQAKALVRAAEAGVSEVEAALARTIIRSPIDGTILRRFKDQGEMVTREPLTLVFSVGDLSHLRVRAEIDESDVGVVEVGQRVYVVADAFRGKRFGGKVARVASRLGSKTLHTERPSEKTDTKVLEALIDLDADAVLPVGLRVDVFVER
jgi:HlyD family secretion protein